MEMLNIIKFQLKVMYKTSVMIMMYFIYPTVLTLIVGYLAQNNFSGEVSSYEYYSIGMMLFIYIGAGIASAYNFIDKPIKSVNLRMIYTPVKTYCIYLSQILSGTIFCSLGAGTSMIIFRFLLGVNYAGSELRIFALFITLIFMSNALGIFLCTFIDDIGIVNMIFNAIQTIFCVLGGAFFSLGILGEIGLNISKISPVKWAMDAILESIYDGHNSLLYTMLVINIIIGIIFVVLCEKSFKTENYI